MTTSEEDRRKIRLNWYLVGALLFACIVAWPLISGGGLLNTRGGGDSPFLLQRLHQLEQAILDGHFPVRWMGDAAYGYGYPFFNFYAPLAFYIAFLYRIIGFSYVQAIQLSQLTAFITAAWGAFTLAKRWYRRDWVAMVVSAAYTAAPFHLVNVYVRGDSIAEFWAMAFYPLVILAADNLLLTDSSEGRIGMSRINAIGWLGLAYGGLIISHNISALIFSPFILLFMICRLAPKFVRLNGPSSNRFFVLLPKIAMSALGLLLGVAVSAWFWLPALSEQHLTSIPDMTAGYFNYNFRDGVHFRSIDLVQSTLLFNPTVAGGQAFRMGLIQATLMVLSLLGLSWRPVRKRLGWGIWSFMVIGLAVATFMLNPWSIILWDTLPLLSFTQFPWRFLSVQAFFTAMLSGVPVFALVRLFGRRRLAAKNEPKRPVWIAPLISGVLSAFLIYVGIGNLNLTFLPVSDSEVTAESLARYEWFTRNIGTTVSAEYLPPEAQPRPFTSPWLENGSRNQVNVISGEAEADLITRKTDQQSWQISVSGETPAVVVFPTLFWDGWGVLINEESGNIQASPSSGLIQLSLPPGDHEVVLALGRTQIRLIGEFLSLSVLVFLIVLFATDSRRWQLRNAFLRFAVLPSVAIGATLVAMFLTSIGSPISSTQIYSQDFAQLGWLHPQESIAFQNGVTLENVQAPTQEVIAGDTVRYQVTWSDAENIDGQTMAEISLFNPATNFKASVFPIAAGVSTLESASEIEISIPADAPSGLFVPQLVLSDGSLALTDAGETRGNLFLSPIRVLPNPTANLELSQLNVQAIAVEHPQPDKLELHLAWQTNQPIAENLIASFRLTNANGREIHAAQQDFQPGYGNRPTSSWLPDQTVYDIVGLKLPQPVPFEAPLTLLVYLYDENSGETKLFRRLGTLEGPTDQLAFNPVDSAVVLPSKITESNIALAPSANAKPIMSLHSYRVIQAENGLDISLYWQAHSTPPADYTHFVHLIDPNTGLPVAQHDTLPGNYTWPTSQMVAGQIIEDRLFLPTDHVLTGEYVLTTGLYENLGDRYPRLTRIDIGEDVIELDTISIGEATN
ncbi:MAG: hypothetical protein AAGD96_00585 [Chloroflexota bacterium]